MVRVNDVTRVCIPEHSPTHPSVKATRDARERFLCFLSIDFILFFYCFISENYAVGYIVVGKSNKGGGAMVNGVEIM